MNRTFVAICALALQMIIAGAASAKKMPKRPSAPPPSLVTMSRMEFSCTDTADCNERLKKVEEELCPGGQYAKTDAGWTGSGRTGRVASIVCMPIAPQAVTIMPSGDDHRPPLSVQSTPVTLTRPDSHWLLNANCSRLPTVRQLNQTAPDGRLLYEAFCMGADETLSGNTIISTASGMPRPQPAKHKRLGCLAVDTRDGHDATFWRADSHGFMSDQGSKLAFSTAVEVTDCPTAKKAKPSKFIAHKRGGAKRGTAKRTRR